MDKVCKFYPLKEVAFWSKPFWKALWKVNEEEEGRKEDGRKTGMIEAKVGRVENRAMNDVFYKIGVMFRDRNFKHQTFQRCSLAKVRDKGLSELDLTLIKQSSTDLAYIANPVC